MNRETETKAAKWALNTFIFEIIDKTSTGIKVKTQHKYINSSDVEVIKPMKVGIC